MMDFLANWKTKLALSILALLFGIFIVIASLLVASQIQSMGSSSLSERVFYTGEDILPDHVFYPFLMVADRAILSTSFGNRKIYIKIKLADDRLHSAKKLIEKGKEDLALSTMTKSQKYLITAVQDFYNSESKSSVVRQDLIKSIKNNSKIMKNCADDFVEIDPAPISALLVESETLVDQLSQ